MTSKAASNNDRPIVHVGWVIAVDLTTAESLKFFSEGAEKLRAFLAQTFSQFEWQITLVERHRFAPQGSLDPLPLLELGVQEKLTNHWDYALVAVTNELRPRTRTHTIGVPSSALETAVLSTASLGAGEEGQARLVALALHLLGHVWGLEHEQSGSMMPPEDMRTMAMQPFSPKQQTAVVERLQEVADHRLEEEHNRWGNLRFYWHVIRRNPRSIVIDVLGYRPWLLPFRMGRLTAATAISILFLLIATESWQVGTALSWWVLLLGSVVAICTSTTFLFKGQNLGQVSREVGLREQLTRTQIVIFSTLSIGIFSLWLLLLAFCYVTAELIPLSVLTSWLDGVPPTRNQLLRQAVFMALLGILAGGLGGNLEEEDEIKAELFFDEET